MKINKDKINIIIPTFNGKQSNPILFTNSMKKKIMKIKFDVGAKNILKLNKKKILNFNIDDLNIVRDFDSPNDFNY